jgi:hypothetical protein
MKLCKGCKTNKEFSEFNKNIKMKDGYLNFCKECLFLKNKEKRKIYYLKNKDKIELYLEENKDKIKERSKKYHLEYYKDKKDKIIKYQKEYRIMNIDAKKEYEKEYRSKNKEKKSIYHKNRKEIDYLFKFTLNIRNIIYTSIKNKGHSKTSKTQDILGCSFEYFKIYIESKFENWMSWDNKGLYNGELNYGWDIDHIIPLSSAKNEEEIIKLNHYTNLQPLCSRVNRDIKKDKIDYTTN